MKVWILLISLWCLCRGTPVDPRSYLITAPLSLRLDAEEEVVVQLFGFTDVVTVHVILKTSMAPNHVVLARKAVILNAGNNHQASAKVRLYTSQVSKSVSHVTLHVQSAEINQHLSVPVSRTNGYLFIQTDKPLYTPQQRVKVRVFSLNQELRPANRDVSLTFRDPISKVVDIVEMTDANNGIPSMQNDFKIPLSPMLGIWSIEASYSDFTTTAATEFEVKEYVLPSFSIQLQPEVNFISYGQFQRFNFRVSAMYLHGAPVADGEVFLRYGYVSGKNPPVVIPKYLSRERLSSEGKVDVILNIEQVLSNYDGPKDLISLMGKYLYIAVLLKEDRGGISKQAEFATVKFIKSPYTLSLVSTPPFIKPGLPFNIQVLVKDHLDKPVNRVKVRLVERQLSRLGKENEELSCPDSSISQSDGLAFFICNTPIEAVNVKLTFQTEDSSLPPDSQASLTLRAVAYHSPNQRYLYIDPPLPGSGLRVGQFSNIRVYSATPAYVPVKALSYLVLSKGKVVRFGSQRFVDSGDSRQTVRFEVTPSMVPSIRLVVYYILFGEGTSELVADSVWLDIRDKCVNGLQTDLSYRERLYEPKENLQLDIRTNQVGLVALSAVDSALFTLRSDYRDPVATVLRRIEESDQGCGGGGGKDAADVFRLAGLTFITNANVRPLSGSEACTAVTRPKRNANVEEIARKAKSYGVLESCCHRGMRYIPKSLTCLQYCMQLPFRNLYCRQIFCSCCEFYQQLLEQDQNQDLILARHAVDAEFQLAPHLVRSFFPESWLWEVQPVSPGLKSITSPLPDSITTWEIKAVGVFGDGICVAAPVKVAVSLPLSVDIPLPYQLVRGEQVELKGSVYNRQPDRVRYCVTLTAGPSLCVLRSRPDARGAGLHSTPCSWDPLYAGDVGTVTFTVLGLEAGEHTLTFTLKTQDGQKDVVEKKLRVVPEGVRREQFSGGTLDPRGIYGTEKRRVELKNNLPTNMVPKTAVERMLSIRGEAFGDFLSVMHDPEGLRQLINLPVGSSVAALGGLLPLVQVYRYLETMGNWDILGEDIPKSSADVRKGIREGLIAIRSFRLGDSSYSVWMKRESSTWMTALVVATLSMADQVVSVDRQSLSDTVAWLISSAQQPDGSFSEKSSFKPNRILAEGTDVLDQKVYLTAFTLIALTRVQKNKVPIQQLQSHVVSMRSAANYISQHAAGVKSVYVLAVATYALTLHDPNSFTASSLLGKLERLSREKGHPAVLRYWQESSVTAGWLKPDQSSGLTVETTAYVLLTVLLKGRISYANPILSWLTQDQHYGEGFHSLQETVLTLEAVTEYTRLAPNTVISQDISIRYKNKGHLAQVQLSQSRPVATPIQVTEDDTVIVSTDNGRGVSNVKMKTVYYETTTSSETCHFDLSIELRDPDSGRMRSPHLVACAKYRPPPNELQTESTLTVMKIQLPTGVEAYLEDLRQFRDTEEHLISHYELQGNTVVLLMETVPSHHFLCVGFRIRTIFNVIGISKSLFSVFEPQDKGSFCSKQFSYETKRLQLLCAGDQCQCMTATCAAYRGKADLSLTAAKRTEETCQPHIKYAFKVSVTSSFADGDFVTYKATIDEVLKRAGKDLESVGSGQTVELVRKVTCREVDIQNNKQYLVMGASVSKVMLGLKYRLALDSEALVELWPTRCSSPYCTDYKHQLENFALDLQLLDCPKS